MQLPDPTVRAKVDDGHRLIFVDSANVALREFVARDIRRGELRVSTRHRCIVCACSVTQDSIIQVVILVENHFLDDSHAHLSVACFATRDEQTPLRGKHIPSASTRTGLSDDVSSFVTVASRAVEMMSSGSSCRSISDGEITCRESEHSQTASRFKDISPKVASAGLVIYSGLHQLILHSPSTPSTRGQRDGRDHVEPLARDGVTSSAKI